MKKVGIIAIVLVMLMGVSAHASNEDIFTDVSDNAYYAEAIKWALANGITNGIGNNQFGVGRNVTRAEAVTFLWRAAGKPQPKGTGEVFTDLDPKQTWYHDAIRWAVQQGITNGVGNNQFNPNGSVTNQEMITFLYRAKGSPNYTGQGQWYSDAVRWANSKGLFNGIPTKLNVETRENCLRENVVYFLWKEMQSGSSGNSDNSGNDENKERIESLGGGLAGLTQWGEDHSDSEDWEPADDLGDG